MLARIVEFLKNLVQGAWKPTIAGIFGVIIGVCLTVIVACGAVLRRAMFDERAITDPTARIAAVVTRDGLLVTIGALCLVMLVGAIALAVAKFLTAIAYQRNLKHRYDRWKNG